MTDPIDDLRSANPIPDPSLTADTTRANALFQEITMTDHTVSTSSSTSTSSDASPFAAPPTREALAETTVSRRPPRKLLVGASAAAAAAIIGFGAVSLIPGTTTPAAASMINAAQQTQAADSGTVTVTLDVNENGEALTQSIITDYSGADLSTRFGETNDFDFEGPAPELRIVDDVIYVNDGDQWLAVRDQTLISFLTTVGLPTDVRQTMSAGVVELLERADDAVETSDGIFSATVTALEVKEVAESFPGFGVLAEEALDTDVEDEVLQLDVVLDANGLIDTVTLGADDLAENPDFEVDVAITVDFDDLDSGAEIEAPADAEDLDLDGFGGDLFED